MPAQHCSVCGTVHHGKCQRPSAAARGYGRAWQALRSLFLIDNPTCNVCGRPASQVDHVLPKRRGGTNEWRNLQALCGRCHRRKTAREAH